MKKIFFSVATAMILSAGWAMYSCSNDDELEILQTPSAPETVDVAPRQRLINDLQDLNEQLMAERSMMETRGRFTDWIKKNKVTIADVVGAVAGSFLPTGPVTTSFVAAAASALAGGEWDNSYLGYLNLGGTRAGDFDEISDFQARTEAAYKYVDSNKDSLLNDNPIVDVNLDLPAKYAEMSIEVGRIHNLVLDVLNNEEIDLESYEYELTDEEIDAFRSKEFVEEFNRLMPYFANMDYSFVDSTKVEYVVIMKFAELYEQYSYESEDVEFIINKYIEFLENDSTLTDDEKGTIYTGFAVAAYSNDYWNKTYLKEKSGE